MPDSKSLMRSFLLLLAFCFFLFFPIKTSVFAGDVVINEFVPDSNPEWVEFYNASSSAEFLKTYWLDDDTDFVSDAGNSSKKLLTDLNIVNSSYSYIEMVSVLNNAGDFVVLFNSGGAIVDQYQYNSNPGSGVSIGRNPDRSGSFLILVSSTKGLPNSGPQPTVTPTLMPTATPTPTNSPTNTPTPKPPTSTPTPTLVKATPTLVTQALSAVTPSGEVLAEEASFSSPTPASSISNLTDEVKASFFGSHLPQVLIAVGGLFLLISGGSLLLPKIRRYNMKSEETSNLE